MSGRPIVFLTALEVEYLAARAKITDRTVRQHPRGTRFETGRIAGGRCRAVLVNVGRGNHSAAVLAERAIAEFDPVALMFVGVAGSLRPGVELGDVVVATRIYPYHGGLSEDDGFKIRPQAWDIAHGADQIARHVSRTGAWRQGIPVSERPPAVHFAPIAAGEVVLNSTRSPLARRIRDSYNDAAAIEMEAAGVAQAGHLNGRLPVVVVRGISDRADGTKEATDRAQWQSRAAANATAYATVLAENLSAEERRHPRDTRRRAMPGTNKNEATGQAMVGMQIGVNHGEAHVTIGQPSPIGMTEALTALHGKLQRARTAGRIDEATYTAANAEIAEADNALKEGGRDGRSRLVLALKKIWGLISDVADLAADVAALIAMAQGLS